jgi:hypothetical protein
MTRLVGIVLAGIATAAGPARVLVTEGASQ